ncbi:NHL repeat-containing protein [Paraburkholderia heleia]|uniref:hypothetical protein n=1 Tax=Paraburkholderia heleia TaxID=634127 RepID=UPI002AB6C35F|nr:hypothetical protein [Paraburkholderia heleia]
MVTPTSIFTRWSLPCRKPSPISLHHFRSILVSILFGVAAISINLSTRAQELFIGDAGNNTIQAFNGSSGAYRGAFVTSGSAGLTGPAGMIYTDGELVVVNQNVNLPLSGEIFRFDGKTGMFLGKLVSASDINAPYAPRGIVRGGPDNVFYVADVGSDCSSQGAIKLYNDAGAFLGNLDRSKFTGGFFPRGLVFGPDGLLYVSVFGCPYSDSPNTLVGYVLRFNATTKTFVDVFASNQSVPDLHRPEGLVFDKEGNLWVTGFRATASDSDKVLKLDGKTGALLDELVLSTPPAPRAYAQAIIFGPGNRLYIPIMGGDATTAGELRRCNVKTKVCDVVAPAGNPLQRPFYLIFKNSNPAMLGYGGSD